MTDRTPQKYMNQEVLKKKLKIHIKRELDLGEKVILLLKQKKTLETHLQQQLHAKEELGKKLEETIASKEALQWKFLEIRRELRQQQKSLRKRSRRISEDEEGSREELKTLRQQLGHLKKQLDILDKQKVEDHVRLSSTIKELHNEESDLKQELQKISYQKDLVEEDLQNTVQKYRKLSTLYKNQKKQYQQQIEVFQHDRASLETRIAQLLDEHQKNEQKLHQEVESLKISNTQLEEKVEQLKYQDVNEAQDPDAELLQVIEKQDNFIHELKERAHQRSTMLRTENGILKKKIEQLLTSQENMARDNQMLEASLKGLQDDLAEYLHLKHRFEDSRKKKKLFEKAFQKKITFQDKPAEGPEDHNDPRQKTTPVQNFWAALYPKLLLTAASFIIIGLAVAVYLELSLQTIQTYESYQVLTLPENEFEPNIPVEIELSLEPEEGFQKVQTVAKSVLTPGEDPDQIIIEEPVLSEVEGPVPDQVASRKPQTDHPEPVEGRQVEKSPKTDQMQPEPPVEIVVQLTDTQRERFLPKGRQAFPTIENNIVLRRRHEQKLAGLRKSIR